ncbi:BBSome complex assembly protein BBS10 [Gastrophryne carolinensis]
MQNTKSLDLSKILQVAESLENIVSHIFGPERGQVLLTKATGELLITKDGRKTLECLLMDHPVARMIVSSASKHYGITGDGVKSFVLVLCALLRELRRACDKNEGLLSSGKVSYKSKSHALGGIRSMLLTFQSTVLELILAECLSPHFVSIYSDVNGRLTLCRTCLQQTLDAYFCGSNSCSTRDLLSRLVLDYLSKCLFCVHGIVETVCFVDRFFSELHIEVPGFPIDDSRILPGLLLHREFSVYCPAEGELRALIVTDQIHQLLSAPDIGFVVSSDSQLQASQQYLEQRTERVIKHLYNNHIKLILSSVKQHQIVIFNAKRYGLSIVECLLTEEIELLCTLTGISSVSPPFCDHLQTHSFPAASCQPVILGSKKYVQLVLSGSGTFKPHSLVLKGPIKGLTGQIASSLNGAFRMLKRLFQRVDTGWGQPLHNPDSYLPNICVSAQAQSTPCSTYPSNSNSQDCYLTEAGLCIHMCCLVPKELREGEYTDGLYSCSHMCGVQCHSSESKETPCQTFKDITGAMLKLSLDLKSGSNSHATQTQIKPSANIGLVIQGGGRFEMLLHYYLHQYAKKCQKAEMAMICTVVADALLCIPRHIYQMNNKKTCFPLVYSKYIHAMKNKELEDVTKTGLESVSCKYQLIASVLQCIIKLVTIDLIVGIKREPHSVECEETDEDR